MPIPAVNLTIRNDTLGQAPPSPGNVVAIFGPTSLLPTGVPTEFSGSVSSVIATAGYGPAVDLACNLVSGGATVILTDVANTATAPGAVTKVGTGASVMTTTGTSALDRYDVIVKVVRGGTAGSDPAPGFIVSLDAGRTWTGENRVPADLSYEGLQAQTGLVFVFTAASMVVDDTYSFSVGAPTVSAANVVAAVNSFAATTKEASLFYVASPFNRADASTIATAVGLVINSRRWMRLIIECVDAGTGVSEASWMSTIDTDWSGFANDIVSKCAGYAPCYSVATGSYFWRSVGWPYVVRLANVGLARDAGAVKDGPLSPVVRGAAIDSRSIPAGRFVHNEYLTGGLDSGKFVTIRTWPGKGQDNWYITNPWLSGGPTSDFKYIQHGRVIDEVARLTNVYFTDQVSGDLLLNPSTGKIAEKEATRLESGNNLQCSPVVDTQQASKISTAVSRADDILTTETVTVTVGVVPKGYAKFFNVTLAFARSA